MFHRNAGLTLIFRLVGESVFGECAGSVASEEWYFNREALYVLAIVMVVYFGIQEG
jgi:hypothetical protein